MTSPPGPHHYAAMAAGARCDLCPLRNSGQGPVPPTLSAMGRIPFLVVAEAPSPQEVDHGQTLIGPAGREVRQALASGGFDPNHGAYTNAMLCRPPGGNLEDYERDCKRRKELSPLKCCNPRLLGELERTDFALIVGGAAVRATGTGESVMKLRGTPVFGGAAMPTLHPAFVLRDSGRLMRGVFRFDVQKAVRLARGGGTWTDPKYAVAQDLSDLAGLLVPMAGPIAVDTETDGIDPWTCRIRRIGITDGIRYVIFSPLSVHGNDLWHYDAIKRAFEFLARWFAEPREYYFHNFYAYDAIVLSQHGIEVDDRNLYDSLIGHHIGQTSEFPHGLDFLGSIYTDAPRWKDDVKHSTTRDDAVLDKYLSFDLKVTHVVGSAVKAQNELDQQTDIYKLDVGLARVGRSMSRIGVKIDPVKRKEFVQKYEAKADELYRAFVDAAGRDCNPGSVPQVRRLLYESLGLPVLDDHRTDTDEPGTGEACCLDLLARGVDDRARAVIQSLLGWRGADKILGTYVGRSRDPEAGLPVHADGRIRATWKVHGTPSGRWSCSPNLQNIPDELREMFVPGLGNIFVAADYSAIELRILALLANDEVLVRAFDEFDRGVGPDLHTVNACTIFKCTPDKVTKEVRVFAKRFVYGLSYGAGPPKIFQTLSLLRDEELKPVFPGLTLRDVEQAYKAWWQAHPAITAWRTNTIRGWRRNGFIATPWHGRRRYFVGGENHEEMYNHPIQGAAADVQNTAVLRLTSRVPFDYSLSRGLILQVHDQLVIEAAEGDAERIKGILAESMTTQVGPMRVPAEVKIGKNWKEV